MPLVYQLSSSIIHPLIDLPSVSAHISKHSIDLGSSPISDMDKKLVSSYLAHYFPLVVPPHISESPWIRSQIRATNPNANPLDNYESRLDIFNRFAYMEPNEEYLGQIEIWQTISDH